MSAHHAEQIAETFELSHLPTGFHDNPYPIYRALREHAPVKRMEDGSYFLTRYDDLVAIYKNPKSFSSDKNWNSSPNTATHLCMNITPRVWYFLIHLCTRAFES